MEKYFNNEKVISFLNRLKPLTQYSNQRFDEEQQLAAILAEIDGHTPGYSIDHIKIARAMMKERIKK